MPYLEALNEILPEINSSNFLYANRYYLKCSHSVDFCIGPTPRIFCTPKSAVLPIM